ncbi:MAG: hypothetical protein LBJ44_04785 [Propionibacteriaceae bacterium]|jgi:hypothetical protein|nr:hypothetical protein [Propionibacteriaceae bacterium]
MGRTSKIVAAMAVAAAMALSGCAQGAGSPGAAAVVDGVSISEHDVSLTTDTVVRLLEESGLGEPVEHLRSVVVTWIVQSQIAHAVERQFGVELTEAERETMAQGQVDIELMLSDPLTRDMVMGPVDLSLFQVMVQNGLFPASADQLSEFIVGIPVQVSPRYGVWVAQELSVSGMSGQITGSLSEPVTAV